MKNLKHKTMNRKQIKEKIARAIEVDGYNAGLYSLLPKETQSHALGLESLD